MSSDSTSLSLDHLTDRLQAIEARLHYDVAERESPGEKPEAVLRALCRGYLRASEQERAIIRNRVRGKQRVLIRLLSILLTATERVRATGDAAWLQMGAAAGAIHGGQLDFRDFLVALAELYVAAEDAGLDPDATFKAIGGGLPKDFETYPEVEKRRDARGCAEWDKEA